GFFYSSFPEIQRYGIILFAGAICTICELFSLQSKIL
ncbi:unnamed protein product, partial [marine sediment metagenome]